MSSSKDNETNASRRDFIHDVAAGAAGVAIAGALATLGAPVVAAAQEKKKAESPFFRDPPPWPKGTTGNKYDHLFSTKLKENSITDVVAGPQAYFRGDSDPPGAKINMGWQMFTKPYRLELESHHHDTDEYLFFLGATLPDLVGSFEQLGGKTRRRLAKGLRELHAREAEVAGLPSFGVCSSCRFFKPDTVTDGAAPHFCKLYDEPLSDEDAKRICIAHALPSS